jgi:histidinol-phosphatase (PHP family)
MKERILYETHMHTPLCKHCSGEPEEYAAAADKRHFKGIIVTCHNPEPRDWSWRNRMMLDQFDHYVEIVQRARQAWLGRIDVRLGLECDWVPGAEEWLVPLLRRQPFDYVLGSVHPAVKGYKDLYYHGDVKAFQITYFEHLAHAAETKLFDCLSHPDLVKNCFPSKWDPMAIMPDIQRALDRIAKTGVAMELNTSGLNKDIPEMNPGPQIMEQILLRHIPVVVGADAHKPERVGADFDRAFDALQGLGCKTISIFLERKRQDIPIQDAVASLRPAAVS